MDGTQCEKAHTLYMEGMATIVIHVWYYHLILVYLDFAFLCCLAGLLCCLAQGCSWSGIPTSSSGKERFFGLHFLIPKFWPSYLLKLQCCFFLELGCVLGCNKGRSHRAISELVFQWRGSLSIGGSERRARGNIFTSLASSQPSTIPHSAVTFLNCVIFWGNCWEGSLSSSGGSISE